MTKKEPNWLDLQMEEDLAKVDELIDMAKELKERYCSYSGLLSTSEYMYLDEEHEEGINRLKSASLS
jgi:hypothetical protein